MGGKTNQNIMKAILNRGKNAEMALADRIPCGSQHCKEE